MSDPWPRRVAILGVGLLGGSVGLALRRKLPEIEIVGTSRSPARRDLALKHQAVDHALASVDEACRDCDVVVVASPVDHIAAMAKQAAAASPDDCLITDVGSTKAGIVAAVSDDPRARGKFVAAHPIAGSEKTGVEHADARLFDQKVVVITPDQATAQAMLERGTRFWQLTGGRVVQMTPDEHDAHLAAVSHVPHLVSALVASMAHQQALPLVGSGWRDITRVAAGDPTLWTAICQENRDAISRELQRLATSLAQLQRTVEAGDDEELFRWLSDAKKLKENTSLTHRTNP
ncbi:MAG: prephenate dehydrogenase [Pirellulales bacterium]|nr:prephenate dehydrogenase [Pirellulales bacterium]